MGRAKSHKASRTSTKQLTWDCLLLQRCNKIYDLFGEELQVVLPLSERQREGHPLSQHQLCLPSSTALL